MFSFMFFIILFEFVFIVKVYGNWSHRVPDNTKHDFRSRSHELNPGESAYEMEYDVPVTYSISTYSTTRTTTSTTTTTTTTPAPDDYEISEATSTSTTKLQTRPIYMPIAHFMALYPNLVKQFNKTVEDQIRLKYGEHRPDKYGEVATSLLQYFLTLLKSVTNGTLGSAMDTYGNQHGLQTLPPLEDYIHEITPIYKKISTDPQFPPPPTKKSPETESEIYQFQTTLKPVTQKTSTTTMKPENLDAEK